MLAHLCALCRINRNVKSISLFSSGEEERNAEVYDYLFSLMPPIREKSSFILRSRKHLHLSKKIFTENKKNNNNSSLFQSLNEENFKDYSHSHELVNPLFCLNPGMFVKDLCRGFPDFDIENTLLIDDCLENIQEREERSFILAPQASYGSYHGFDFKNCNSVFYLCGVLQFLFNEALENKKTLCTQTEKLKQNLCIYDNYFNLNYYEMGLRELKKYNPKLEFLKSCNVKEQSALNFNAVTTTPT